MARDARQPDGLARPKAPYSPVVVSGDHVFTAGQVGFDAEGNTIAGGIEEQTRQVFANLSLCLDAAGCTFDDVVKVNAFLTDLANFQVFNDVYSGMFSAPFPARTTVQAGLAPGLLVEVEAIARRPS
jgi:2-iminobutanoate/2-iminopropanoate deaminase